MSRNEARDATARRMREGGASVAEIREEMALTERQVRWALTTPEARAVWIRRSNENKAAKRTAHNGEQT
jgi:hypothetical protein